MIHEYCVASDAEGIGLLSVCAEAVVTRVLLMQLWLLDAYWFPHLTLQCDLLDPINILWL